MKSLAALPLIVLLALAARVGYAASFDCEKASNKAEILVCGVPELSSLDVRLSQLYSKARKSQSTTSTLRDDQRAWLKQRNLCVDLVCLTSSYQQRIAELVALPALQRGAAPKLKKEIVGGGVGVKDELPFRCRAVVCAPRPTGRGVCGKIAMPAHSLFS